ncbi:hypothetical protein KL86DYS1_10860 [uncultured Dysgonomonas sp.]|uniref:Uncharacterized protein n=1 Tax=uncultured Dysgonomonas sp. TaxID=206096 RepID=A0A212J1R5_9BACT|nr:hypothetical protein KL86DYS1_10860 [uncultured Dysgonomonas sp.]
MKNSPGRQDGNALHPYIKVRNYIIAKHKERTLQKNNGTQRLTRLFQNNPLYIGYRRAHAAAVR